MKPLTHLALVAAISLLPPPLSAKADLVAQDDATFGAGAITLDTDSGLGWLDLPVSVGLSYKQVASELNPGGTFEGFRYASKDEVLNLFDAAHIPGAGLYLEPSPIGKSVKSLISLIGTTSVQAGRVEAFGIVESGDNSGVEVIGLDFLFNGAIPQYSVTGLPSNSLFYSEATRVPTVGSWLVAQQVPEPGSCLLGSLGGAVLWAGSKMRRK